jgi:hypothetical protein
MVAAEGKEGVALLLDALNPNTSFILLFVETLLACSTDVMSVKIGLHFGFYWSLN